MDTTIKDIKYPPVSFSTGIYLDQTIGSRSFNVDLVLVLLPRWLTTLSVEVPPCFTFTFTIHHLSPNHRFSPPPPPPSSGRRRRVVRVADRHATIPKGPDWT